MSFKSKVCVDAIVAELPDTKASQWKRRSKMNLDGSVFRIFENIKTGAMVNVIEKDNTIEVDLCKDSQAKLLITTPKKQSTDNSDEVWRQYMIDETGEDPFDEYDEPPLTSKELEAAVRKVDMDMMLECICPDCGKVYAGKLQCRNTGKCPDCSDNYSPITKMDVVLGNT